MKWERKIMGEKNKNDLKEATRRFSNDIEASLAKLKDFKVDSYPAEMDKFEKFLSDFEEEEIAARYIKNKIGNENYQLFEKVSNPKFQNGIQMNMPYKITVK